MKYKTKAKIIDDMSKKKCWDIPKELAEKATKKIQNRKFLIYSPEHYKTIYCIINAKLNVISDPILKIAYIDCLSMNYLDMGSERINAALDIATGVVSGAVLGVSITDLNISNCEIAFVLLLVLVFQALKTINLSFRKWDFYLLILKQIKSEITGE